ncbi:MAG: hypothetical protein P3W91_001060 [Fervidobacterium sp.]|nr:hypothetical protein [Fervidobacterium sp.]
MSRHTLVVYLFKDIYELHKTGLISNKFILNVLREMKEQNELLPPVRRKDFVNIKKALGEGGEVYVLFPPDLHDWYKDIYENTKRGLWVKLHYRLLDKLAEIYYDIHNKNSKEV